MNLTKLTLKNRLQSSETKYTAGEVYPSLLSKQGGYIRNLYIRAKAWVIPVIVAVLIGVNVVVLAKFNDTANALSQQRETTVKVKHELETSSKRLQELSEQKVDIESSLRAERLKAEEVKQENKRLKQDLHSKRQAEAQAKVAAVKPAPVQPAPAKQAAPAPAPTTGNCSVVNNYNWDKRVAYAVCMAESGGNPNAANLNDNHGSCVGSYGLMQVACIHGGVFTDPKQNMDKAFEIYSRSGWQPWGAYTNGSYAKYL